MRPRIPRALLTDTFYIKPASDIFDPDAVLLRVHTSPMQIRAMEQQPPPIYIIVPGRVYRPDSDATHTPQFHQIEGLAVDTDITLADLKGTLLTFARAIFGPSARSACARTSSRSPSRASRSTSRASTARTASPQTASAARICKGTAWIEILGAGMVDPNVLELRRATTATTPSRSRGSRSGWGSSGSRCSSTASPICGCSTTTTSASWSSS